MPYGVLFYVLGFSFFFVLSSSSSLAIQIAPLYITEMRKIGAKNRKNVQNIYC